MFDDEDIGDLPRFEIKKNIFNKLFKNGYTAVYFLEKQGCLYFEKDNSIEKILSFQSLHNMTLYTRGTTAVLVLIDDKDKKYKLRLERNQGQALYDMLLPHVSVPPSVQNREILKTRLSMFATATGLILILCLMFNVFTCQCSRSEGLCTIKSYGILSSDSSFGSDSFKLSEYKSVNIEHIYRKYSYDKIHILTEKNGQIYDNELLYHFYLTFAPQKFADKLNRFFSEGDSTFSYSYVPPLVYVALFIAIFLLLESFTFGRQKNEGKVFSSEEKKYLIISSIVTLTAVLGVNYWLSHNLSLNQPKLDDKDYVNFFHKAAEARNRNDYQTAIEFLNEAKKIHDDDYALYLDLSRVYMKKKDYNNVVKYSLRALKLNKEDKPSIYARNFSYDDSFESKLIALNYLGNAYKNLKDYQGCDEFYTELINTNINPKKYEKSYYNRGLCLYHLGKKDEAHADFIKYKALITEAIKNNSFRFDAKDLNDVNVMLDMTSKDGPTGAKDKNSDALFEKYQKLSFNPPTEYNNLTKSQIYDLRKKYVASSLFASHLYKPNDEIFGQIEDKKPWYGLNSGACPFTHPDLSAGPSARSIYINNPNLLLGVINPLGYKYSPTTEFCKNKLLQFIPKAMYYDKDKKMIIVRYNADNSLVKNMQEPQYKMPLSFVGINARDFGYKHIFVYDSYNIIFTGNPSIAGEVYELKDFIHNGSSCKIPGGCNNTSPLQPNMDFYIRALPAGITFKLWQHPPMFNTQGGDIYMKVLFEEF